jgi:ABC-type branched-subunit amino acid transport system substrate-binding protein
MEAMTNGHTKVALLLPLTGPNKPVGQAMLDAANMALFDVSADLALLPRDTGSTPDDARAAAGRAVSDGAAVILGPVFATSVPAIRDAVQPGPVNAIAYTTDATMAGGNVFVMGFLPAEQIDRVVGFAKSRGLTKLAALVPDNSYGTAVSAEITALTPKLGLQPPHIMVLGRDPKAQLAALNDDPPQMLLLALGGDQLAELAPTIGDFIAAHPVQLLGTGLWADDPALPTVPALAGGWYAAPLPADFATFASRFQQIYNYKPPRIATLAYDSVALAWSVTRGTGGSSTPVGRDALLQPNGFIGIDGGFRFLPTGLSERNLAVLAVGAAGPTVVDPPPPNFEKVGE